MLQDTECGLPCDDCGQPCGYATISCSGSAKPPHRCPSCPLPDGMCAVRFGEELAAAPEFKHVRDLEWFDGPLISEFRAANGGVWIEKWVDCSDDRRTHRWVLLPTTSEAIERYLAEETLLISFIQGDGYLIETSLIEQQGVWSKKAWKVSADRLPKSYLCSPDAKHDPSLRREDA